MKILLLAGEESGVLYAERLKERLLAHAHEPIEFWGYAESGFHTVDLAVMGILPVLKKIFYFLGVAREMKRVIREWKPDAVITIDYPGLNLKLASYAKNLGIPALHVVCPQVWAWHRGRVPKIAAALTRLLCFFPFEPAIFKKYENASFRARFIGHPMADVFTDENALGLKTDDLPWGRGWHVALLPGSRHGEIERILPRLIETVRLLNARFGVARLSFLIPAASARAEHQIGEVLKKEHLRNVALVKGRSRDILRSADVAAVASGTATLEAAFAHVPTLLVYATTPTFAWFLRYFVTGVRFAGLVNIIWERSQCGGEVKKRRPGEGPGKGGPMQELLQEDFTPEKTAELLGAWLMDDAARNQAIALQDGVIAALRTGAEGDALSNVAREVLQCVSR